MPDFRSPHHLPNLREGRQPPEPAWLPRQRRGTTPQMIGRYPDYDVFDAADTWDEATRAVVERRLRAGGELRFFTAGESPALRAFCDTVMAQDREPRIPVAEMIDEKLACGQLDGYQYADMPDDGGCWRLVLRGLDETARQVHGAGSFAECGEADREAIVERFSRGQLGGGAWDRLNVTRAWSVCMRMVLAAFYSHPWSWNEIGFGGPAYPRGFMRLGPVSTREPFEKSPAVDPDPVRSP